MLALGPRTAGRLALVGIRTVAELVAASPLAVSRRLDEKAITSATFAEWQREAQLIIACPELSSDAARLLAAAGFASAEKVRHCSPTELLAAIESARQRNPDDWLAQSTMPTVSEVSLWIHLAGQTQNSYAA